MAKTKQGVKLFPKLEGKQAEKGFTNVDMGLKLGIASFSYMNKKNGKREFKLSEAKHIAEILDSTIEHLFFAE